MERGVRIEFGGILLPLEDVQKLHDRLHYNFCIIWIWLAELNTLLLDLGNHHLRNTISIYLLAFANKDWTTGYQLSSFNITKSEKMNINATQISLMKIMRNGF